MAVKFERRGTTGFVTLANPPVNAMGLAVRQGLDAAVTWAEAEPGLTRVIVSGGERVFAAGGDAREFDAPPVAPHLPDVLSRIETSTVPWIAAIRGVALGGGCELALACRYRIAHPDAQLGLPEVTLGVIPGAGGTQRLPRLVGYGAALDMIATGRSVTAPQAKAMGLIDLVSDTPDIEAEMVVPELLDQIVPLWERPVDGYDPGLTTAALQSASQKSKSQLAPQEAVRMVEMAALTEFDQAMLAERETFIRLRNGDQARALRHIFFAERAAKAPDWLTAAPLDVRMAAVVGGGTMGAGIAYALLSVGLSVCVLETDPDGVARAQVNVDKLISQSLSRGFLTDQKAEDIRRRLTVSDDYSVAADAELAIEAAFESLEVKQMVFGRLEAVMRPDTVLASNTSYLDLDQIANCLSDPGRLVGLHFFAPAHVMKLLEIVRGAATNDLALATGYALAKRLRKIPVLSGVCDGFIGNRILQRYREAADTVFMDGSTPWEVDEAMVDFGYAMGPYEAQDLSGLDIAHANRRRQDATRDPNRRYIPIADRMVELGKLGRKTGAGWYRYPGGGPKVDDPIVADLALEECHFEGRTRTDYNAEEIRRRLLLAMINEAAEILNEGIAQNARDIDLVTVFGYGFPRWRGGLMHYADTLGAEAILAQLKELSGEDALVWRPSPVIEDCAARGIRFADWSR